MKNILTITLLLFSFFFQAQEGLSHSNDKRYGEYKYVLTKEGVETEEEKIILENIALNEFFDTIKKMSVEFKVDGYEIASSCFRYTPYGQKTLKLGIHELELTVQKDDQEKQTRSFIFENVSYHEGNDQFKIQIDQLGEEGYSVLSYNKNFTTYERLSEIEND